MNEIMLNKKGIASKEAVIVVLMVAVFSAILIFSAAKFTDKAGKAEAESRFQLMERAVHAAIVEARAKSPMEIDIPILLEDNNKRFTQEQTDIITLIQNYLDPDIEGKYTIHLVIGKEGYENIGYAMENSTFIYHPKGKDVKPYYEKSKGEVTKME